MKVTESAGPTTIVGALTPTPLPRPLSSFVGRRQEIDELLTALSHARLLTLIGAGGCGKTRLAIELAVRVMTDFASGVAFADLAPINDPDAVGESIAAALGLGAPAARQVPTLIGSTRLMLVIDNAEHLVDAVSELVAD